MKFDVKNKTIVIKIICGICIAILWGIYLNTFKYGFIFKEQSSIFLCTKEFFLAHLSLPGGIAAYAGGFVAQFYKIPLLGGLFLTLIFFFIWVSCRSILLSFKKATNGSLLALYPVILLSFVYAQLNCNLSVIIAHLPVLLTCWLYVHIKKDFSRYSTGIISIFLLYWTSNVVFYSGVAIWIMYELFCKRQKLYPAVCILYLLLSLPVPGFTNQILSFPKSECYFPGYWIMKASIFLEDIKLIYASFTLFPVICLLVCMYRFIRLVPNHVFRRMWLLTRVAALFSFAYILFTKGYHPEEAKDMKTIYLLRTEQWNKIIEQIHNEPHPGFAEMFVYNFALAREGLISKDVLNRNNAVAFYRPEAIDGVLKHCITSEIYFHLGLMNGAFYGYFNVSQALNRHFSAYCLQKTGYIEMVKGNYPLAKKYFRILGKTMLYAKDANQYLQLLSTPELISNDPVIREKRNQLTATDFFWNDQLTTNLKNCLDSGINNRLADEYMLGYALLSKNIHDLLPCLEKTLKCYYSDADIPDIYQQALLCCYRDTSSPALAGFNISNTNKELYDSFRKDVLSNADNSSFQRYKGTYFYYIMK